VPIREKGARACSDAAGTVLIPPRSLLSKHFRYIGVVKAFSKDTPLENDA